MFASLKRLWAAHVPAGLAVSACCCLLVNQAGGPLVSATPGELARTFGAVCEDCKVNPAACLSDTCKETSVGSGVYEQKIGTMARHGYSFEGNPGLNQPAVVERPQTCFKIRTCTSGANGKASGCTDCGPESTTEVTTKCTPKGKYCTK